MEKHYVSKRSRRQKGLLAFVAQDSSTQAFCYGNADLRKEDQNDEILNFAQFWKERSGKFPQELIFDSKLTTYANLDQLNHWGVEFITLRRRSKKMFQEAHKEPLSALSAWRHIELDGVSRIYKTLRILDTKITLKDYRGPIRQLVITELAHDEPIFLLTNQMTRSAPKLIERYAQRKIIENNVANGIDFFHMDALSSSVAMKVNLHLQLTLMASSLCRPLGSKLGNGYGKAKSNIHSETSSMPAPPCLSREKTSSFAFKKGLTIRCSSQQVSTKLLSGCHGQKGKHSTSSSAETPWC